MVSKAIRQVAKKALMTLPWAAKMLRHYVRYSPSPLVVQKIHTGLNGFYCLSRCRFMARTTFGSLIAGDTSDIIQRYVFLYGLWEPNLTSWLTTRLKKGDVFVDVGANIGYFSLLAATIVGGEGRVVAIEASPSIFEQLRCNVNLNRAQNVRMLNRAASDRSGTVRLFRAPASNLGESSTFDSPGFEEEAEIEAQPLNLLVAPDEMARTRVIKIDVEGGEIGVVTGLLPLLKMARQDLEIAIEVGGGPKGAPTASASAALIVPMLVGEGFNVFRITNNYGPVAYARSKRVLRPVRVWDFKSISEECDLIFSRCDTVML